MDKQLSDTSIRSLAKEFTALAIEHDMLHRGKDSVEAANAVVTFYKEVVAKLSEK